MFILVLVISHCHCTRKMHIFDYGRCREEKTTTQATLFLRQETNNQSEYNKYIF